MDRALLTFSDVIGITQEAFLDPAFPVSFELRPGEVGIVRGGGRASALIRLAAIRGMLTKGSIEIMGAVVSAEDDPARYLSHGFTRTFRRLMGFCHNLGGLFANMSLLQNVMLPAHYHSGLKAFEPFYELAKVELKNVGVPEDYWECRPCDVPPELQKRALLARSVINEPKILILEEPTGSIPWSRVHGIASWVFEQRGMGRGILIATSDDPFAGLVGDWMVDLDNAAFARGNDGIRNQLGDLASRGSELIQKQMKAGGNHA